MHFCTDTTETISCEYFGSDSLPEGGSFCVHKGRKGKSTHSCLEALPLTKYTFYIKATASDAFCH